MNTVDRATAALAVLAVSIASLAMRNRSSGDERQQTIRVGVDLVNFGVVVTDKQGAPVTGLTATDFEVIEEQKQ